VMQVGAALQFNTDMLLLNIFWSGNTGFVWTPASGQIFCAACSHRWVS